MRYLPTALVLAACSPAAAPRPAPVAPAPIALAAPSTAAARPLPSTAARVDPDSVLPNANTVLVFDGERLAPFGLGEALALALAEGFELDLAELQQRCGLDLSPGWLRQVVVSSEMFGGPAVVVATRASPEPLLDCIAQQIPDATTEPLGAGAAIRIKHTTFTTRDGKLLFGSREALQTLLKLDDPSHPDPSAGLREEMGGSVDARQTLALLDGSPNAIFSLGLVQPFGAQPGMSVRFSLRDPGDGTLAIELTAQLPERRSELDGFGELGELGELEFVPDQMIEKVLRELPAAAEELLGAGPDASAVSAIVETVELERDGERVQLRAQVPDAARLSHTVLAALAAKRAAQRAELEKLKKNIAP